MSLEQANLGHTDLVTIETLVPSIAPGAFLKEYENIACWKGSSYFSK